jgi:hypothetical protein
MNDDILRYSAFGAHYRLKLQQVALLGSRDFYKFLATVCNQETHEKSLQTLEHILTYMQDEYHKQVEKEIQAQRFTIELKRVEKNMLRVRIMRSLMQDEIDNFRIITEAEIRRRCQKYYKEVLDQALSDLLNYYGINFPAFADMYMMEGTSITILYAMDHPDLAKDLMDTIEKRRRYEIDKERRSTD